MTTPTQPAEPGTEAGRRLLAGLLDYDALPPDRMSWNRDAILAIEAEASRDAAARVEGPDLLRQRIAATVLQWEADADVIETSNTGTRKSRFLMAECLRAAAAHMDGLLRDPALAAEPVPAAATPAVPVGGLDVDRLRDALDAVMPGLRGETVACEHGSNDKRYLPAGTPDGDFLTPGDFAEALAARLSAPEPLRERAG